MKNPAWTWTLGGALVISVAALAQDAPPPPEGPPRRPPPAEEEAGADLVLDLRAGTVRGAHPAVRVLERPSDRNRDGYAEARVRVDLYGYRFLEVVADYDAAPAGFTLDLGDSSTNDGGAGDAATQSNDAEVEVHRGDLRAWSNDDLPANQRKLAEWSRVVVEGTRLRLRIADGELRWQTARGTQREDGRCLSPHLFALDGQPDREGPVNYEVFLGLNRVVSGRRDRTGSGLARVRLRLVR
ncbi:MAG: hypothetical protein D6731_14980 [Planctomycetota bacterium]|nr:MAG: hypothetical protein D6731_14980 [Planctomycetota bacterium]